MASIPIVIAPDTAEKITDGRLTQIQRRVQSRRAQKGDRVYFYVRLESGGTTVVAMAQCTAVDPPTGFPDVEVMTFKLVPFENRRRFKR